ncbi:plasmid mobilization relaxosome protein MobC [Salinicola rhizosphaerae]|uniref:Bacterial mobilisation domain-containing protein n=1 Tax=Salinicola rhizosphaerae TaxID=1443141 RepID=A0ABQ3DS98_9GAMM|nr:plasmid mobilization relaxosome protein MobC [Salinicola rhizosphaerae]GHB12945.1 hypothetical protein GCM10009038_08740 [Salinicola rhizosphaerae]
MKKEFLQSEELKSLMTKDEKETFRKVCSGAGYSMSHMVRTLMYSFHAIKKFNVSERAFLEEIENIRDSKGLTVFKPTKPQKQGKVKEVDPELINHTNYLCSQFDRIGNNINQIAKHLNTMALEGQKADLNDITDKMYDALFDLERNGEKIQALVDIHVIYDKEGKP